MVGLAISTPLSGQNFLTVTIGVNLNREGKLLAKEEKLAEGHGPEEEERRRKKKEKAGGKKKKEKRKEEKVGWVGPRLEKKKEKKKGEGWQQWARPDKKERKERKMGRRKRRRKRKGIWILEIVLKWLFLG